MTHLNKTKSLFLLLGLACLTTFFITCKNPTDNILVTSKADFVSAGRFIYVTDAATGQPNTAFNNAKITAVGAGADYVYSVGGKKNILMNEEGIIQYAFRRGAMATNENPLEFNFVVEIPGYRTEVIPVKAYDLNSQTENVSMLNLANLPKGLALFNGNATADGSGVVTTQTNFTIPVSTDKPFEASVTIPSGTKLLDDKGNAVTGPVTTSIIQTATTTLEAFKTYGKFMDIKMVNANGSPSNYVGMLPVGGLDITIQSATAKVKSFSQPLTATMELSNEVINSNTGNPIKEGETLQVVSKDEGESTWKVEANTTIKKDGVTGKLYADFSISHLSTWNLASAYAACSPVPKIITEATEQEIKTAIIAAGGSANVTQTISTVVTITDEISYDQTPFVSILSCVSPTNTLAQYLLYLQQDNPPNYKRLLTLNIGSCSQDILRLGNSNTNSKLNTTALGKAGTNTQTVITTNGKIGNCAYTQTSSATKTSATFKGKIKGACTSGQSNFVILPTGTVIKYTLQSNKSLPKTDAAWKEITLSVGEGTNAGYNTVTFTKNNFMAGGTYTFATLYDNKWYTYDYTLPAGAIPDEIEIVISLPCQ
ncbi:MAG: hypothetical protein ACEQSR_08855 [Candidatus Methylacidiphilales bacterium]